MRYIHGQYLPAPARLFLLSRILGTLPQKLYPEYLLDFSTHKKRIHGKWWNHLVVELTKRGWSAERLARGCRISIGKVYGLINWKYPPTEKMLRRLEKGLRINRDEFWRDWKHQQWEHFRLRKMVSREYRETYR